MATGINAGTEVYFNPWDEAFRANPYPHYKALYGRPPVVLQMMNALALVARYADATAILHDHERFSSQWPKGSPMMDPQVDLFGGTATILTSDPPTHTRLRKLVSRAFTPKRIKDLEPRIREITSGLLDRAEAKGELEVIGDLAMPLPVTVIAEMLGVPASDYTKFKYWSDRVIERRNILPGTPMPTEIITALADLRAYLAAAIEKRRQNPADDLIGALITAQEEKEALSADEVLVFVILLLVAGNETTTNLIGNGMLALGRNPDQLEMLRSNSAMVPKAIEEMLRYDGPVQSTGRHPLAEVEVGGTTLKPGMVVMVMVAAANRDPAQFPDPDKFDITRNAEHHLAFGDGIHFCLGAALARMEGQIAFSSMIERFPKLRLAHPEAPLTYKGSYFLRGLAALPFALR
jgi:cytochrome P450